MHVYHGDRLRPAPRLRNHQRDQLPGSPMSPPAIDLSRLPAGAASFFGRDAELDLLDAVWADGPRTQIVTLVAAGGVGKTALVKRWLDRLKARGWGDAERVFGWSFFSQVNRAGGAGGREASEDIFLAAALEWLGTEYESAANPWEKGLLLARVLAERPTLLVLDGIESLQYPPGPVTTGQLRAPGLQGLLRQLASAGFVQAAGPPGLVVITSRQPIGDLAEHERDADHPDGAVLRHELENLSPSDGARLLHQLGCNRAGAAEIEAEDDYLAQASAEVQGHALTLTLLGGYLRQVYGGDIRKRDTVRLTDAADALPLPADQAHPQGRHAFRVMAACERWLERGGEDNARELAVWRLLGLFDRPADPGCLEALRAAPPIRGLTEALFEREKGLVGLLRGPKRIAEQDWRLALGRLADAGLIERPAVNSDGAHTDGLDTHPLVHEYLAQRLRETYPGAWRKAHRRLYEHLKSSAPHRPESLSGLQPLYQAISHGCMAGMQRQALDDVFRDRILRGTERGGFYSTRKLGAFGADLDAISCFFEEPWEKVSGSLPEPDRACVFYMAGLSLGAAGRLDEALRPTRLGIEISKAQRNWEYAAIGAGRLSQFELALGLVSKAVLHAKRAVVYADRSNNIFQRMARRTNLADALHQEGRRRLARDCFREAERLQAERHPNQPRLYSVRGYRYCELLLAEAEQAAWQHWLGSRDSSCSHRANSTLTHGRLPPLMEENTQSARRGKERVTLKPGGKFGVSCISGTGSLDIQMLCEQVADRAAQMLKPPRPSDSLLSSALDHLSRGRAFLLLVVLEAQWPPSPTLDLAAEELTAALDGLRAAGTQEHIPAALFARGWLYIRFEDPTAAGADLDAAWQIAARGDMRLSMADCLLHRARLFRDRAALVEARRLIEEFGYGRRLQELVDAERAASEQEWAAHAGTTNGFRWDAARPWAVKGLAPYRAIAGRQTDAHQTPTGDDVGRGKQSSVTSAPKPESRSRPNRSEQNHVTPSDRRRAPTALRTAHRSAAHSERRMEPTRGETMQTAAPNRTLVYISYSHKDKAWHKRLRRVLDADPLIRQRVWDDTKIRASAEWHGEIEAHFRRARVLIMLGSPDYFAPHCGARELEIEPGIAAHANGELAILWVPVRAHPLSATPVAHIMAATGPGAPSLDRVAPEAVDVALAAIRQQVRQLLELPPEPMTASAKRFRIAFSFPGERRDFVERVAEWIGVRIGRTRVLYDPWYEAEFARVDLDSYLQNLYHDQSDLIAVFLCAEYEKKDWCGLEWRAVKDLIKRRRGAGIMPLRFDHTEIPGLFSTDGYIWIGGNRSPEDVAELILERWQFESNAAPLPGTVPAPEPAASRAPLDDALTALTSLSPAVEIWRQKLKFLQAQEAITTDPGQRFQVRMQIEECQQKIRTLGGQP